MSGVWRVESIDFADDAEKPVHLTRGQLQQAEVQPTFPLYLHPKRVAQDASLWPQQVQIVEDGGNLDYSGVFLLAHVNLCG